MMLSRMGWCQGQGLGRQAQGIVEPLDHTALSFKQGVGFQDPKLLRSQKIVEDLKRQVSLHVRFCRASCSQCESAPYQKVRTYMLKVGAREH
jgi:hypothetical protein